MAFILTKDKNNGLAFSTPLLHLCEIYCNEKMHYQRQIKYEKTEADTVGI